jgi:transposase
MKEKLKIELSPEQRQELVRVRDHDRRAYLRERAAAIIKIADGQSGYQVALRGLLKRREPDTIYDWVERYRTEGLHGLEIRSGRGRKPAFSPSVHGG